MRTLTSFLIMLVLIVSAGTMLGQQNQNQNASPEQQTQPAPPQGAGSSATQSVVGCVVKSDEGYSLKTDDGTYPINTEKDLSQYVNKKVKVTGVLEQGTASGTSASGNPTVVRDIRLRMVATVIGDCDKPSK